MLLPQHLPWPTALAAARRLATVQHAYRSFSTTASAAAKHAKPLPPRPTVNESDIEEAFLRGSGPGGQKIVCRAPPQTPAYTHKLRLQNKTSCAVQLKHLPTGMVVKSQETRSRTQNRKIARRILAEKIELMEKGPESRTMLKAAVRVRKKASKSKKAKRKYRALEEAKAGGVVVGNGEDEEDDDDGEDDDDDDEDEEEDDDEGNEPEQDDAVIGKRERRGGASNPDRPVTVSVLGYS
ncbi:hypothetical protein B0A49_09860 [Cryomyces minteri]|uniref:Prokaryotic-type class I peptide chain release factors domain-containing protein n=1 Tax=Cryomyces minteri TaxID=331657 RepID=A0A4V5NDD0_9PEZI|nr:hypothetical protein B0A49_09860 [Cryomyces minteri]